MRYDIHFRSDVVDKIQGVVESIRGWNSEESLPTNEIEELAKFVFKFEHCPSPDRPFLIGGADGSGDFPCVTYGDSFVYLIVAMARLYEATTDSRLRECIVSNSDIVEFLWLPEDKRQSNLLFNDMFSKLIGEPLEDICKRADYYELTRQNGGGVPSPADLIDTLIRPEAHDADNISIQLLATAESGSLIRLMKNMDSGQFNGVPIYFLEDTTLAMPMITSKSTLFFEIAKRYACTIAREKGFAFFTLSKSHNMPHMDLIEDMVQSKIGGSEHWFMRIPTKMVGEIKPEFLGTRSIPPVGAISYLFRLHKTTQPMRLDMDFKYWKDNVWREDPDEMRECEKQIFRDLDFASHDQRCYGYPYPIKACHDMASLTNDERLVLRKQIISAAEKAGLKRKNFIDPSIPTGHK